MLDIILIFIFNFNVQKISILTFNDIFNFNKILRKREREKGKVKTNL